MGSEFTSFTISHLLLGPLLSTLKEDFVVSD